MADNRNFVNKFANEGGGDIFVEDAKLSESTSTTTMTTEGVLLKGTDGAFYEIDKASLSEVIRAELGNILADNSKDNGTSVGKVPTLNSTGNALGASSVANLASVLSGTCTSLTVSDNLDDIKTSGVYCAPDNGIAQQMGGTFPPVSLKVAFRLEVGRTILQRPIQRYYDFNGNTFSRAYNGTAWSSWSRSDAFGCGTATDLALLLGDVLCFNYDHFTTGNSSETISKGETRQGLLYCCLSNGEPSLFALGRTSISATIVEGSVKATDISFNDSGKTITITKPSNRYLYVVLFGY